MLQSILRIMLKKESVEKVIIEKIADMREAKIRENYLKVEDFNISMRVEDQFSVIIGAKSIISEHNLLTALNSITELIKNEYFPPEKFKNQLDGIINLTLIKELDQ